MKGTRFITSALAAVMLVSGSALPAFAETGVSATENAAVGYSISALSKPVITKATKGRTHIKLNWKKVKGASGYKIYQKTSKGWKCVKTIKRGSKTTYTLDGFNSHTVYYFKLRAYKKSGGKTSYSKYSAAKKATTKYGLGTTNYTNKNFSIDKLHDNWYCFADYPGYGLDGVVFKRSIDRNDRRSQISEFSISAEKLNKERWDMTLEEFVAFEIGDRSSYYHPDYFELTGYREIDGCRVAVLKNTLTTHYILMALEGHELYKIEYSYMPDLEDTAGKEIEGMLDSMKFTPQS